MDPNAGHIIDNLNEIDPERRQFYRKLEGREADLAREFLAGRKAGTIDISGDSELAKVARGLREWQTEKPEGRAARRRLAKLLAKATP